MASGPATPPGDACAACGLLIEGGGEACQRLFDDVGLRAHSDLAAARVHRLAVDTYALQHPDRYCRSAKSLAAHLTGLCCAMEHGGSPEILASINRWLSGSSPVEKPALPAMRGAVTIGSVSTGENGAHAERVERWARSTWDAYQALHPLARRWIAQAQGARPRG